MSKIKLKTRKALVKRFKITGTGQLLRNRPGKRHKLTKKSSSRKRSIGKQVLVCADRIKVYRRLLNA